MDGRKKSSLESSSSQGSFENFRLDDMAKPELNRKKNDPSSLSAENPVANVNEETELQLNSGSHGLVSEEKDVSWQDMVREKKMLKQNSLNTLTTPSGGMFKNHQKFPKETAPTLNKNSELATESELEKGSCCRCS